MQLKNVTLELSGKAFLDDSEARMDSVARRMFRQWRSLTDHADAVSVMLWIGDGSEILDYTGNLNQTFEWGYWCGVANNLPQPEGALERQRINTHHFPQKYREDATPRPYSWLKRLIEVIRETGVEITGKPIRIGATFDNGPEFSVSDFKYRKHREIAKGNTLYPHSFVTCNSILHGDPQPYAGFPNGIAEGTTLGRFLGGQFKAFSNDLGYDYIWLSNGMGFGTETWKISGELFDLEQFHPERADRAAETLLNFWRDMASACPGICIETRGSNFSAGVEIASDAAPLPELYRDFKIAPPVNSPWAAINENSGLEIAAWMSHVAELPDERFPFRFYTHDPWFMNSPWLDRYGREPWDIYQPLSVSRLNASGKTETPNRVSFLTVDDTMGQMPEQVPNEVIPHILKAFADAPDEPGPLVWVYPFYEYSEMTRGNHRRPDIVFNEDLFFGETIQGGAPVNTVISTGNFKALASSIPLHELSNSILVVPVSAANDDVIDFISRGGNVIFYGALCCASEKLRDLLLLDNAEPICGEVEIGTHLGGDTFTRGSLSNVSAIEPQFNAGGLTEVARVGAPLTVHAVAIQNGKHRVTVASRKLAGGAHIGFIRSILSYQKTSSNTSNFTSLDPLHAFPAERWLRHLLEEFAWKFRFRAFHANDTLPRLNISRHDNAFFFSLFAPDTSVEILANTPFGAPLLEQMETIVKEGDAIWHPPKSWHKACRCFVKQVAESSISCKIGTAEYPCYTARLNYYGFQNADVRFFPPRGFEKTFEVVNSPLKLHHSALLNLVPLPLEWEENDGGRCLILRNITGHLYFTW